MWRKQSEFESAHEPQSEAPSAPSPSTSPSAAPAAAAADVSPETLRELIVEQLKTVFDPEIPVNIYELGLIYDVSVADDGKAAIRMTLTTPMCPAAEELPPEVETKAREVPGVTGVELALVWDPPWTPEMMSEAAKLDLGMV
jgi:FeS assembly SUF system protein